MIYVNNDEMYDLVLFLYKLGLVESIVDAREKDFELGGEG